MGLTSFSFLCFYVITLFFYFLVFKKSQWIVLLFASVIFLGLSGQVILIVYPFITSVICFFAGRNIFNTKNEAKKKATLVFLVIGAITILAIFKYINFPIYTVNALTGTNWDMFHLLVPLGISFYTFTMLGYVIDIYYGMGEVQNNYFRFLTYGIFFPTIVSGPFLRYKDISPSLFSRRNFDFKQVTFGMQRIVWGFFKKLIISERVGVAVNTVYGNYSSYGGAYLIFATILFAIQLYTDFSGCMDIVLGVSQSLGIELPENFNAPFSSRSMQEFWRRWHITLGAWMRDYVFYPVLRSNVIINIGKKAKTKYGKKLGKMIPTYLGMLVLWFVVGFWHGGAWKFIVGSGILHWFYIVTGEILTPLFNKVKLKMQIEDNNKYLVLVQKVKVFLLVCSGFVFFRAESLRGAITIYQNIVTSIFSGSFFTGNILELGINIYDWGVVIGAMIILWIISSLQKKGSVRERIAKKHIIIRWTIYYMLIFCVILLGCYGPEYSAAEFIYQGF